MYVVENREPVKATVRLDFRSLSNLRSDEVFPIERVIEANSRGVLIELDVVDAEQRFDARPILFIDLGASDTDPDIEHMYAMPFGGREPSTIIQAFNGDDTHQRGMRYAIDFAMPEGTPVLAARAGTVIYVQDGFTRGGRNPDLLEAANIVVVVHDDQTMSSYGHLSPGIAAQVGQHVEEGDFLAFSGNTGFTGQPHLHFHVGLRLVGEPGRTIPVRFKAQTGAEVYPFAGMVVAPARVRPARLEDPGAP